MKLLYGASVGQIDPVANKALMKKVQSGKATLSDLTAVAVTSRLAPTVGGPVATCPSVDDSEGEEGGLNPKLLVKILRVFTVATAKNRHQPDEVCPADTFAPTRTT